ncbi:MAG: LolA-like putative outer membrane lipoprotein chaperone [Bacteroides cellulosilyticus]
MDRTATAFRQAGGIQADFTVQTYAKGVLQGSSVGTIRLKGEKFLLDADGVKTWFDGRTQWSYLTNSDEVNVSNLLLKSCRVSIPMPCCLLQARVSHEIGQN